MKRIQRMRQQGLELVGRGEKTDALTENLSQIEHKVEGIRNGCQVTIKRLTATLQGSGSTVEKHQKRIPLYNAGVDMKDAGVKLCAEDSQSLFGNVLQEVGVVEQEISSQIAHHEIMLCQDVIASMTAMLEEDTKKVEKTKKKLQHARLDMDSTRGRLRSAEVQAEKSSKDYQIFKLDTLRSELDEVTKKFEDSQDAYATALFSFMANEQKYTEKVQEFVKKQIVVYKLSAASLESLQPKIDKRISVSQVRPVFGMALEEHLKLAKQDVAVVIDDCVTALKDQWMDTEGLFRITGGSSKVKFLVNSFNAQQRNAYDHDPHTIAGCLKRYLRELPDPLLTVTLYENWIKAVQVQDYSKSMQQMKDLLQLLPETHHNNLKYLLAFLHEFAQYHETTKMSTGNIAIVIGPNLMWSSVESSDAASVVADTALQRRVTELLIEHVHWFFPDLPETPLPVIPSRNNSCSSSHGANFSGTYTPTPSASFLPTSPGLSPTPSSASSMNEESISHFSSSSFPVLNLSAPPPPQDITQEKHSSPKLRGHSPPAPPRPYRVQNATPHQPVGPQLSNASSPASRPYNAGVSPTDIPTGSGEEGVAGSAAGGGGDGGGTEARHHIRSSSMERGTLPSKTNGEDTVVRPIVPVRKKKPVDPPKPPPTPPEKKLSRGPSRRAPPPPIAKKPPLTANLTEEVSSL